jgi:hypothetical protein
VAKALCSCQWLCGRLSARTCISSNCPMFPLPHGLTEMLLVQENRRLTLILNGRGSRMAPPLARIGRKRVLDRCIIVTRPSICHSRILGSLHLPPDRCCTHASAVMRRVNTKTPERTQGDPSHATTRDSAGRVGVVRSALRALDTEPKIATIVLGPSRHDDAWIKPSVAQRVWHHRCPAGLCHHRQERLAGGVMIGRA